MNQVSANRLVAGLKVKDLSDNDIYTIKSISPYKGSMYKIYTDAGQEIIVDIFDRFEILE